METQRSKQAHTRRNHGPKVDTCLASNPFTPQPSTVSMYPASTGGSTQYQFQQMDHSPSISTVWKQPEFVCSNSPPRQRIHSNITHDVDAVKNWRRRTYDCIPSRRSLCIASTCAAPQWKLEDLIASAILIYARYQPANSLRHHADQECLQPDGAFKCCSTSRGKVC